MRPEASRQVTALLRQFSCGTATLTDGLQVTYTCAAGGGSPTPTPTPTVHRVAARSMGAIDPSDPTQTDRLFRSGIPQTCPASTTCAIFGDSTAAALRFVHVHQHHRRDSMRDGGHEHQECTGSQLHLLSLLTWAALIRTNICTNWIGDSGSSPNPNQRSRLTWMTGRRFVVVVSEVTPEAGCPGYTVTVTPESICGGGGSPTPTATATPTCPPGGGAAGRGRRVTHTRQRSCVMASPRLRPTSTSSAVWIMAQSRTPLTAWISPLETGNPARRPPSPVKRLLVLSMKVQVSFTARTVTNGSGFFSYDIAADSWTTLGVHTSVRTPTVLHQVPSMARCSSRVGAVVFCNAVWVYDIGTNSWSPGTAAPLPFLLAGYHQIGQFLYVVGGFDPTCR